NRTHALGNFATHARLSAVSMWLLRSTNPPQRNRGHSKRNGVDQNSHGRSEEFDEPACQTESTDFGHRSACRKLAVSLDQLGSGDQRWKVRLVRDVEEDR